MISLQSFHTQSSTLSVYVECVNDDQGIVDKINGETESIIDVLANNCDVEDNPDEITVVSVTQPPNGQTEIQQYNTVVYTLNDDFCGDEVFQYTNQDTGGQQATASVLVEETKHEANPDYTQTMQEIPVNIDVLANDLNDEDDPACGRPMIDMIISSTSNGIAIISC